MNNIKLKQIILDVLKSDDRLWNKDKTELNQTLLLDLVENIDEKLIDLLLQEKELRDKFFVKIKDVYVFKTNDFRFFIEENKVDNSYTQYKNRIGLTDGKKFLKDTNDVVLNWPYKDCVLEGGQSTEEGMDIYFEYSEKTKQYEEKQAKRKEIFFNSVLAHDEIDRLFDHKALTNWKRFTKDGEQEVGEIKRDEDGTIKENLIIKGNNLLALHSLKKQFAGKVKLIYIDPPYNTGNDGFKYNDNFNHSTWLTFMKNRLEIARELLRDDGVIFVQCDDNEQVYLKVLMDEVFGKGNFVETLFILNNLKGNYNTEYFANVGEYCYVFAKNKSKFKVKDITITDEEEIEKWEEDDLGYWKVGRNLKATGENAPREKRPTMFFPLFISDDNDFSLEKNDKYYLEIYPITNGQEMCWNWSKEQFLKQKRDVLIFRDKNNNINIHKKQRPSISDIISKKPKNLFYHPSFSNTVSAKHIQELFNGKVFLYSKSEFLIKDIIDISTQPNDIVLDYHLGSGTTCAVAHKMGRQYIGIEQMDYVETIACERLRKVIQGEQGGISKSVNWQGGGDLIYFELAKWNETAKEKIIACESLKELETFFDEMHERYFLNYNLKIKEFKEKVLKEDNFRNLSLEEQKKIFIAMLDNNQMYVNKTEMADKKFGIDKKDQELTEQFYNSEK